MTKNRILTKLPIYKEGRFRGKTNYNAMVGMKLGIIYLNNKYNVTVLNCFKTDGNSRFLIDYNGYVKDGGIECSKFISGHFGGILNIIKSSKNKFEYSSEYNCWFGWTQKGEKFAFDGDDHIVELIKNNKWKSNNGRIESSKLKTSLHKLVYGNDLEFGFVIDHISNEIGLIDKWYDNRRCNLRKVTMEENCKNKKPKNELGYTGLYNRDGKYYTSLQYRKNGVVFSIITKRKAVLEEAILDNLITQRYLGYKHQEEHFYKLNSIAKERILEIENFIIEKIDEKFKKHKNKKIKKYTHEYIISEDNSYITVYDSKNRSFIIDNSLIGLSIIEKWNCYVNTKNGKSYVMCKNNKGEIHRIHRLLFDMTDIRYKDWIIDHVNGDGLDNRMSNLVITTHNGNMFNIKGRGYHKKSNGKYMVHYMISYPDDNMFMNKSKRPIFCTEEEAIYEVQRRREYIQTHRIQYKSKAELDLYLSIPSK